jgi:hypothetical protein
MCAGECFDLYKIAILICMVFMLLFGCSSVKNIATNSSQSKSTQSNNAKYQLAIYDFSQSINEVNGLFIDKIINDKSQLSDEAINSIKGLIDVKLKETSDKYQLLSQMTGNKQDEIDALKKAFDKLKSMRQVLDQYKDSQQSKDSLYEDWKIVNNYWSTYYELSKKD